jgi:hexosaminidase
MMYKSFAGLFVFIFCLTAFSQEILMVVPQPQHISHKQGSFLLQEQTVICAEENLKPQAHQLLNYLRPATGIDLAIVSEYDGENVIKLQIDNSLKNLGPEGYVLDVNENSMLLSAAAPAGLFWAFQTLRQLLPNAILRDARVENIDWRIPCVRIQDSPRFEWRGLMIDCSRTFWSKEVIKRYIDVLAFYKLNVLHMHLTDDQGWRLEIKKYPELTEKAAQFDKEFDEPKERQGYYSQDDIRELVAYASERFITIVPEIEMPGHSAEVFTALPQLSCSGELFKIHPFFKGADIHKEVLCAGNDETFDFLKNVLNEVVQLFPSKYIHVGGDEAPKKFWQACPKCQERLKSENLANEDELQSWFIKEIEKYLDSKGKNLIGWNEILEGGLAPNAAIMFWHGNLKETLKAAEKGHKIVMSPTSHCYFDYTYERISTEKVYGFNPVPKNLGQQNSQAILGVQANFWSHINRTVPQMDRQLFPRLLALAEVAWTDNNNKNWDRFSKKINDQLNLLDLFGIYYFDE